MNKTLLAVAMSALAAAAHAEIVQSWRAVVIPNPTDPNIDADPAFAPPSTGTTLDVHPGESILFVWSVFLTDTTIPAAANPLPGSLLRGIGASTSQIVGSANANGFWQPVSGRNAGVYNSNGVQGVAGFGSFIQYIDANTIKGITVVSNGYAGGSGNSVSAIDNQEGKDILGMIWSPQNYLPRAATFVGSPYASTPLDNGLWYRNGPVNSSGAAFPVTATGSTSFTINIIPAPASLSLFALAALTSRRRRW